MKTENSISYNIISKLYTEQPTKTVFSVCIIFFILLKEISNCQIFENFSILLRPNFKLYCTSNMMKLDTILKFRKKTTFKYSRIARGEGFEVDNIPGEPWISRTETIVISRLYAASFSHIICKTSRMLLTQDTMKHTG